MTNKISQNDDKFSDFLLHSKGPSYENNNCFVDSIITAMFFYTLSPFFLMECDNDYCSELKDILCDLVNNEDITTTKFRQKNCSDYMKGGQQDASEFLTDVLKKIDFVPPLINLKEHVFVFNKGTLIHRPNDHEEDFITLNINQEENQPKPINDYLNSSKMEERTIEGVHQFINYEIISADCLIFNIIRYNNNKEKIKKTINTPRTITINGVTYFRAAVVCHNGTTIDSGHYTTLFWDGKDKGYYKYDDMKNDKPLGKNKMEKKSYEKRINKDGVLFFYYIWYG